jgi:5-methylcytosine-specific restriction protein A
LEHDGTTEKPVHIVFQNIDYDDFTENEELIDIYLWKPEKAGMTSGAKITKKGVLSSKRKANYTKPTTTERKGLVTSRVGQGYFRNLLIEKFDNKCAVTGAEIHKILIASHIVPWSESTEDERLNENNGILLSPLYDALFDKHLISFSDDGSIIISSKIGHEIENLNIDTEAKINVNEEMKLFLSRHRNRLS